ncbi:MAG TPA: ATP-binding protein [Vicinamibacterales bacterium]|nr:ATP-binding protein [Vicinamibacterales bacterium]
MALGLRDTRPAGDSPEPYVPPPPAAEPRRALDSPRFLLVIILILIAGLAFFVWMARRSTDLSPMFLSEVVLYALTAIDLTMLVVLGFVLARNILKLVVERRKALPFARFRAKLVAALLAMALVPAVLVSIIGSEIIRTSADRWFSAPVDEVVSGANQIAGDFYAERRGDVVARVERLAEAMPPAMLAPGEDVPALQAMLAPELRTSRARLVELYRLAPAPSGAPDVELVVGVETPSLPRDHVRASAAWLALRAATSGRTEASEDPIDSGGVLVRAAAPVRDGTGRVTGAVVAGEHLDAAVADNARRITTAYEQYNQAKVLRGPLQGVYLSFFLMMTLVILVSATWLGLYVAKRITRPVQQLAEGARAIGAGRLDHRIEPQSADELGSLIVAFNTMAAELHGSQRRLDKSRVDLERKHLEVEERRRYIATVLDRIATGVVSMDADGAVTTINGAAARLLDVTPDVVGQSAFELFAREDLKPLRPLVAATVDRPHEPTAQEVTIGREGREMHLAAAATALVGANGLVEGRVLVVDDVTPLIRAQRVAAWRDVARRLAHEIKNPLTPIQLSAERLKRHFRDAPPNARSLVDECTTAIVTEVEALKNLVDEFAQFARMPAPRTVPTDLNALVDDALSLYAGLFPQMAMERAFDPSLPPVRIDPEQIRRVVINLVDNAIEALTSSGTVDPHVRLSTAHDAKNGVARLVVADNGPGIPPADRDKLFMPYYSTKLRGSGLGLAIVRRIVAEHGGSIEAADESPRGTRFAIELPV